MQVLIDGAVVGALGLGCWVVWRVARAFHTWDEKITRIPHGERLNLRRER